MTRFAAVALTVIVLWLAAIPAVASPDVIANGNGTATLIYQPEGGVNDGTDEGGPDGGKDAFVISAMGGSRNNNYGTAPAHHTFNSTCNDFTAWSYFQWDVSSLPAASDVVDVRLILNHRIVRSYGWPYQISPTVMVVRAPTGPWNEMTLTLNNQPGIASTVLASVSLPTTSSGYTGPAVLNITELYKEWRSGARPNHGIVYSRPQAFCENANESMVFSSDHPDPALRPRLEITYQVGASDELPPVTTAAASPPANGNGWHNGPVTVTLEAADDPDGSGVASISYSLDGGPEAVVAGSEATVAVSTPGEHALAYHAVDNAGNAELTQTLDVRIDLTPPSVDYLGNSGSYTVDEQVAIICRATDDLSGVLTDTCTDLSATAYDLGLGTHALSATAVDRAGNTGSGTASFEVQVTFDSLSRLTKRFVAHYGIARSLTAKLQAAAAADERGNRTAAERIIAAFVNEVSAQTAKALTAAQAEVLIELAAGL